MKKITTLLFSSAVAIVLFASATKNSGGKINRAGSPGEGTCSQCHTSSSASGSIVLRSNIPAAGYTAGTTYHMKVVIAFAGKSTWGVDIEALNSSNTNIGSLVVTDATNTWSSGTTKTNIMHSQPGATADSMVYNFDWTAPATGAGTATIYYSGIAANGNGNDGSGDYTYNGNKAFSENLGSGIENLNNLSLNIYPNPAQNELQIISNGSEKSTVEIFNINGELVSQSVFAEGETKLQMNLAELNSGIYFVKLTSGSKTGISKLIKQ